ncbi:MAG: tripartite tricarboxylate transporter permease [bacterium]
MDVILDSIISVVHINVIALMLLGIVIGIIAGALPGLTTTMSVVLLTPFTFALDPLPGLIMLLGIYIGAMNGGAISAILINTPGTPASAATCFDGYPLARQGKASLALNVNFVSSTIGGIVSVIVLILVAKQVADFALRISYFEMFAIAVFGLSIVASISEKSIVKGLIMGALGMLISTVGFDPIDAFPRFTYGVTDLFEGVSYIPLLIGVFAIPEALEQVATTEQVIKIKEKIRNVFPTKQQLIDLIPSLSISTIIGIIVGAIPGTGGDIASFAAYDQAKKISKHPEEFGKGSLEGLAAAECANNAVTGGAMIPMLTLGIPGDAVTAILLGALIVHGIHPGPRLFEENPQFVYSMYAGFLLASILIFPVCLLGVTLFARTVDIPKHFLWPLVVVLCVVGSFSMSNSLFPVGIMIVAGIIGYLLRLRGFPMGPLILGVILGPLAEENLLNALRASSHGRAVEIFASPIALILFALTILSILTPVIQSRRKKKLSEQK